MGKGNRVDMWELDHIQFPRLLSEIMATQDNIDWKSLCDSMDIDRKHVVQLFERAQLVHEWNVDNIL